MTKPLKLLILFMGLSCFTIATAQENPYVDRFLEIRDEFYDPANGYFSPEGAPYHSIETLIVEAPDHGHESTSELYSYWVWLEAMYGRISGDWQPLNDVWTTMEDHIIPTAADQPTNAAYNPSSPATYAPEFPDPCLYPSPLGMNTPVGQDPVSAELASTYGTWDVYGMHWLIDADNFYGYGTRGDGVTAPSYINTFQRGEEESVWETVPHPSWEEFNWGGENGFLPIFIDDQNYAMQWRYTNAPDADARAVQAMYWASEWVKEQNMDPEAVIPMDKARKMGDYLRLAMFDKYFKPLGAQDPNAPGGGYESAHYLMSWYYAWGGSVSSSATWAWRIGSSHCHFGYQNPVAAWALSSVEELQPESPNAVRDWSTSLDRQLDFYRYLLSEDGAIAGGATNSWNGDYSAYPAGKSTFYGMAYDDHPVYHDPGSNTWAGWQAWSVERVAEYYYLTNDERAKEILDRWIPWVKEHINVSGNTFQIPATLQWSGEPDAWNPSNPGANSSLSVEVTDYGQDLGIAAGFAKALTYYAAATQRYETLDDEARALAQLILDEMWENFRDDQGLSVTEERGDFNRFFEQEICIPDGFTGQMANGDLIEDGATFLSIRSDYENDPEFQRLQSAYNSGQPFTQNYHRSWAQIEIALANAEYGFFFGGGVDLNTPPTVTITQPENNSSFSAGDDIQLEASADDPDGSVTSVEFFANDESLGVDNTAPFAVLWENVPEGVYTITAAATDNEGASTVSEAINLTVGAPPAGTGSILREYWTNITGSAVTVLTSDPAFPSNPAGSEQLTSFEGPTNWDDNYGSRIRGYIHPPVSGSYIFWVAGDDHTEFYLSTDDQPGNASLIAEVPGWTNSREWEKYSSQQSAAVTLTAGQRYYVEVLHKEGGGGDNVAVAWQGPDISRQVIPGESLSPVEVSGSENNPPQAAVSASPTSGTVPLIVSFDAGASTDPDGDALAYSWDFGDGTTATGEVVQHTYTQAGSFTVVLTVTDGEGGSDTASISIAATSGDNEECDFGTPLGSGLPSLNGSYNHSYVIGAGGPDLGNVGNFTINWSLENNGLWQLSMNTTNGQPNWYVDLRNVSTPAFGQAQPDIVFSNSGFPGLDGQYWAAVDGENFVLVSKTGGFSIYFSNSSTPPSCAGARLDVVPGGAIPFMAYPNPATSELKIAGRDLENATVRLTDVSGKVVLTKRLSGEYEQIINISSLDQGVYLLQLLAGDRMEIRKIVKTAE